MGRACFGSSRQAFGAQLSIPVTSSGAPGPKVLKCGGIRSSLISPARIVYGLSLKMASLDMMKKSCGERIRLFVHGSHEIGAGGGY